MTKTDPTKSTIIDKRGPRFTWPEHIEIELRKPEPDDAALGLVLDSWTRAVADHSPWSRSVRMARQHGRGVQSTPVPRTLTIYHHDLLLKSLIPHTDITLACDPSEPSTVWGWECSEADCLHFIYVKNAFRGFGIGRILLEESGLWGDEIRVSHRTPALYSHWPGVHFQWNPYRMMVYG